MNPAAFFAAVRTRLDSTLTQGQVDGFNAMLAASDALPITWRAYLLATAWHETAATMQPIHEYGPITYFDKYEPGTVIGKRLGNTEKGDGYLFRGRGYVQLTGRANYTKASDLVAVDLIAAPDRALSSDIAANIAIVGMSRGLFTGKGFKDYLPGDYVNARRIINGTDKAALIAGYAAIFEGALTS